MTPRSDATSIRRANTRDHAHTTTVHTTWMTGRDPVLASTRLGRVLFWVTAVTMLSVLLMFAFWGLFVY